MFGRCSWSLVHGNGKPGSGACLGCVNGDQAGGRGVRECWKHKTPLIHQQNRECRRQTFGMFPSCPMGRDGLASSFALRRSGCGTGPQPDEHLWRNILTPGFEPRPRLPRLASSDCRVRPGGLLPDTVAQPSPILTAFLHFQRCFGIERFPLEEMPVKELGCKDSKRRRKSSFKQCGSKKFALIAGKIRIARHLPRSCSTSAERVGTPYGFNPRLRSPAAPPFFDRSRRGGCRCLLRSRAIGLRIGGVARSADSKQW